MNSPLSRIPELRQYPRSEQRRLFRSWASQFDWRAHPWWEHWEVWRAFLLWPIVASTPLLASALVLSIESEALKTFVAIAATVCCFLIIRFTSRLSFTLMYRPYREHLTEYISSVADNGPEH